MGKVYNFLKVYILAIILIFSSAKTTLAQDITIGTGTTTNGTTTYPCPIQDYFEGSRAQYLFRASELIAAGMSTGTISALKWNITSLNAFTGVIDDYTIKMGTTTATTLDLLTWEPGAVQVRNPQNYVPTVGVNTFTFNTPFFWNGIDNIIVEVCNGSAASAFTQNPSVTWTTGLSFNAAHTYRADNLGNLCNTATVTNTGTATNRPNTTFSWTSAVACSGSPMAGTTVSTPAVTCATFPFDLSVTGAVSASGLTYQWQSSPDGTTWTDMPSAATPNLTTSQIVTTWYRRAITCTNSSITTYSTPVQVTSPTLVGGTFTINSAVPTGGTNFNSFNAAYDYIKCGINAPVIFNVDPASGPYTEQLIITPVPGASATNTVTFNGNGRTLQFLSTNTNERAVIKLNGADHFRFDSLNIKALGTTTTEFGFGMQLLNNADSNKITRCNIDIVKNSTSTNYAGIAMSASAISAITTGTTLCDANEFIGNKITGGNYGITMVGSTTSAIGNNKVINNKLIDQNQYGVYLVGNFGAIIESNEITRPTLTTTATLGYGVFVSSLNTSLTIDKNRIHSAFEAAPTTTNDYYGISFNATDALETVENKVTNNVIYNMKGNGTLYGLHNSGSDNVWYFHNTVVLNNTTSTATENTAAFFQVTTAGGIEIRNNVFVVARGGTGIKSGIYASAAATNFGSDRNNFFIGTGTGSSIGFFNGNTYTTLGAWQTATMKDANSVTVNPVFVNASGGNFQPTNASMNDLGQPLSITTDITYAPRSATTPDIGAWEFAPGQCTSPPEPGIANINVTTSVCPGTPISMDLSAYSFGLNQTYQWEFSPTLTGTYTNVGPIASSPTFNTVANLTGFYRCKLTCSGITSTSTSIGVMVDQALAGGTYTINNTLPLTATNFPSFNAAYFAMRCGITGPIVLNVSTPPNTVYNEQLLMDSIQGLNATNTITWNGNNNTIRFTSLNTNERGVIRLNGVKHMTFDGLKVEAPGTQTTEYGFGFHLLNNSDSNTIRNCIVTLNITTTSTNYAGIVISGGNLATTTTNNNCDANLIENNTVTGGFYGIALATTATTPAINNRFIGNKVIDQYQYGIYHNAGFNTLIERNEVSQNLRTGITPFATYGIYTLGNVTSLKIVKNRVFDFFKSNTAATGTVYGIFNDSDAGAVGQEIEISNNAIYGFKGGGITYGIWMFSNFSNLFHNTIDFADQANSASTATYGIYYSGASNPTAIRNNLVSITKSGSGLKYGIYLNTTPSTYVMNHNNYYLTGANTFVGFNGANRQTIAQWQAATGQEANSLSVNPLYQSPATGNYAPFSAQLDNRGAPVGITQDILNAARSATTPDIGAWEFAIPPCTTPPAVSTATATPSSGICLGTDVALKLTGITFGSGQTYQWQSAAAVSGPWTNLGTVMLFPDTVVNVTASSFFRCVVTCSGQSTPSNAASVVLNPAFLAGTYTINPALPASITNFTSFTSAVAALYCGITGHVIFNVASGIYTEQIRVGKIPGVGPNATVLFQSATANNTDVTLTFNPTVAANNYTLLLDSTGYFTFRNMTIAGTNATQARVIELRSLANNNTFRNNIINATTGTGATNTSAGIFSNTLNGVGTNTIANNVINGGNFGIALLGLNTTTRSFDNVIDSNTVNNSFAQNINVQFLNRLRVSHNTINRNIAGNTTAYGINMLNCDSANLVNKNVVNISNAGTATVYGIYLGTNQSNTIARGLVTNNTVRATTGNAGTMYGLYQTNSTNQIYRNNIVSILSTSATGAVYGLFHTNGTVFYENNTINNSSTSTATTNVAAHLSQTFLGAGQSFARNNVFAATGGGRAIFMANANFVHSDYNMLYTSGAVLGMFGTVPQNSLSNWINATNWDYHSIRYEPVFTSTTDLTPNLADPKVWGMHGRGVQIAGNDKDFNGNTRPVTFQQGVPDLGAYEFVPTSVPENMVATPAVPVANGTQKFSLGTDTVSVIKWGASVPVTMTGKRYTGTLPTVLTAGQLAMYFYVDYDVPAGAYNYEITQNYLDPWRGFIPSETVGRLGRTNAANAWLVGATSTNDTISNFVKEPSLSFVDKFTVLSDGTIAPPPPIDPILLDTSNMGTRFWVAYGHNQLFGGNTQEMILYLGGSATPATVTVRVNGTPWARTYTIPANTIIPSDLIPKSGLFDARLLTEGWSSKGISITSDVPIVAYAHGYGSASSGASLLFPVGTYGYEYYSTNFRQDWGADCFSWFYLVADKNNTKLEITPSNPTRDGRPAGVSFIVTLNKGEVYQVLGAMTSASTGFDMSGSRVKALPNDQGKCHAFAMFSGSSRTAITCTPTTTFGSGDYINQQNFPSQAWGRKYLTAPTSNAAAANSLQMNIFRVVVKDPTTVVQRNGVTLTGLVNNRFYEFNSQTADYITADKPITVAQYMASSGGTNCTNIVGNTDPEMIFISPIEQGIKRVALYRNTRQAIINNYITLIIPTAGVTSLLIDNSNTFDYTYPHPNLTGYTVVVKRYGTAAATQATVISDSAFTLITYGLGSVESYGYNGGTLVKNLNAVTAINNTLATGVTTSPYTCAGTPFRFRVLLSVQPTQMTWQFSQVPGLSPNADVVVNNPINVGTQVINGNIYYLYTLPTDYTFAVPGNAVVPVNIVHPTFEGCNNSQDITVSVDVRPEPVSDFITAYSGCVGDVATFTASIMQNPGVTTTSWAWNFGDATTGNGQMITKQYNTPGTYQVKLNVIGSDGCLGDTTKPIVVNPRPSMTSVIDKVICNGASISAINFASTTTGTVYNWTNNNTSIGLAATGSGNIAAFTAVNTGAAPVTATIIVTPAFINGTASCEGVKDTFLITVNPIPSLTAIANQTYCHNVNTTATNFTSTVSGTTYNWTNSNTSIGLAASGTSSDIASFIATNNGITTQIATITITPNFGTGTTACVGTPITYTITVNPRPVVSVVTDSVTVCLNATGTWTVQNPITGATYNWYSTATGGTPVGTGVSFTSPALTATTSYWVEGVVNGCNSVTRKRVAAGVFPLLTPPIVQVDTVTVNTIRWRWAAVPNAMSYSVSSNNGTTWTAPSSGASGLTHTITGLAPLTSMTLLVRANGGCQDATAAPVTGKTVTDQLYFPNSFTPNGDGLNDVWRVYGYIIKDIRMAIFNQWGEKVFESRNQSQGWNGEHKGKKQPAGVYMYVVELTLNDGTKQLQKGAINLVY